MGPSGKIGHTPSVPASDSETSHAGQSSAWRNGEQADEKASGSKQPARNAQRPGTRQTSKNARQPAGSRTPESQKLTQHLSEPPHGGIHGLDGLAWSAPGPAQGNAKPLGRVDQGRAQRQGSRSVGTGFNTHTLNLAPPPPPPKQPATTAPPPPPHNPRCSQLELIVCHTTCIQQTNTGRSRNYCLLPVTIERKSSKIAVHTFPW